MIDLIPVPDGCAPGLPARGALRHVRRLRPSVPLIATALVLAPALAAANPDGRQINRATVGCGAAGSCHGTNPGATATLTGPAVARPGARSTYVLSLRSTFAGFTGGGFDISARGPAGTVLSVNPAQANTRLNGTDLVMNSRFAAAAGAVTVTFDLVTPTAGAVTLSAAGNATNGSGTSGDAWALASLGVTVSAPTIVDAGVLDAGVLDAGVLDAGVLDAGVVDVVQPRDSGPALVDARSLATRTDAPTGSDAGTPTRVDAGPAARVDASDAGSPSRGDEGDAGDESDAGAAGDADLEAYDTSASYGYGGCSVGAGGVPASDLSGAWLLALGWIARRRRTSGKA